MPYGVASHLDGANGGLGTGKFAGVVGSLNTKPAESFASLE